jgi:hypothetical protein
MTFNVHQKDAERGIPKDFTGPTPSERFLLFRDLTFGTPLHHHSASLTLTRPPFLFFNRKSVCIILFHLTSAIVAIPTFVLPTPGTRGHLIMIFVTGVLAPLLALVGSVQ